MSTFDLKKIIKEEMAKLNEAKQTIRLDDLTFDGLKAAFPKKYQKAFTTRRGVDGEQEDMYRDTESVSFPKVGSMQTVLSNSALEDWKEEFRKRYGNVDIELDPEAKEWFNLVVINDPKFVKDKETNDAAVSSFMRESVVNEAESKIFTALKKSGKLKEPNGGASMNGKYYQLEGDSKYDVIHFDYKPNDNKPFGVAQVQGHHMPAQILRKLGFRESRSWTAGVEVYIFDGNLNPKYISEAEMINLVEDWSKGFSSYASDMAGFYKDRGRTSGTIDESSKKHIKALMEARLEQVNLVKEGVMAELDTIMDEASDFKDFLKRINRDSRLETSLLNSPDMIKFFTKMWKESGRSL
tara:strand:+ start:1192 stop:2250 length:1059 start_codon:yes stop_codon:yes gene_type:complete